MHPLQVFVVDFSLLLLALEDEGDDCGHKGAIRTIV